MFRLSGNKCMVLAFGYRMMTTSKRCGPILAIVAVMPSVVMRLSEMLRNTERMGNSPNERATCLTNPDFGPGTNFPAETVQTALTINGQLSKELGAWNFMPEAVACAQASPLPPWPVKCMPAAKEK
jgi:hypothetical protein